MHEGKSAFSKHLVNSAKEISYGCDLAKGSVLTLRLRVAADPGGRLVRLLLDWDGLRCLSCRSGLGAAAEEHVGDSVADG